MSQEELATHKTSEPIANGIPSGRRFPWRFTIFLIAVVGGAAFITWRVRTANRDSATAATKTAASAARPTPVLVAEVQQKTMPIYLTELGKVTAYNTDTIKSRVDGQIVQVKFQEGQQVKRGALLIKIDPEPYSAALELAEGQYAKDEASVTMGKAESARYGALLSAGVVSQESQQTQEALYGQAKGSLKADLAAIHAAKVNLAYTSITSPIDGIVGLRQVDVGNIVHATDTNPMLIVTQLQPISVIFTIPEDQLPLIRKKLRSKEPLTVEAYDRTMTEKLATGKLLTVDNQIDATTGMDKLKAVFPNKEDTLFPNQFVNIRLVLENRPNVLVVPATAMQMGSSGNFVYVVTADNTVEARPIPHAITQGSTLLLDSGVKPGEKVVVDGLEKIHAGSKIVIGKSPAPKGGRGESTSRGDSASKASGDKLTTSSSADNAPKKQGRTDDDANSEKLAGKRSTIGEGESR